MRNNPSTFTQILASNTASSKQQPNATQPQEGRIISLTDTTATFVLPDYDDLKLYGPAPFTRTDSPPQPGDKCLVVFVGNGVDRAWVVAWNVES